MLETKTAELSIEVCHLSGRQLELAYVIEGLTSAKPIVESMRQIYPGEGAISVCMLIDDYFSPISVLSDDIGALIAEAAEETSLTVDYVVSEAALTSTAAFLVDHLRPEPEWGAGSTGRGEPVNRYVSNEATVLPERDKDASKTWTPFVKEAPMDETDESALGPSFRVRRGNHDVNLRVELWSPALPQVKYSCSLLAAWWQLLRLGLWKDGEGHRVPPEGTIVLGSSPFAARRTLSILDPPYIEIEHAVRTILRNFVTSFDSELWGEERSDCDLTTWSIDNVAYCFLDRHFLGT